MQPTETSNQRLNDNQNSTNLSCRIMLTKRARMASTA